MTALRMNRWRRFKTSRHDRASEPLDEWDCVDELVNEEAWSQELVL